METTFLPVSEEFFMFQARLLFPEEVHQRYLQVHHPTSDQKELQDAQTINLEYVH